VHPNVEVVARGLADRGALGEIRVLDNAVRTAAEAAAALGCEVGAIANSLIFMADRDPVLILTSGGHRVDTVYVARVIGADRLTRASPEQVRAATGQPIGGVAPVGHPVPVRTFVDAALRRYDVIWAAGGIPHAVFPTTFDELVRVTGGNILEVSAPLV
jgi:prolyl-tRNA editing enzyme YbaK/EbsC (Cys-tRNA(Pro) deacylase)